MHGGGKARGGESRATEDVRTRNARESPDLFDTVPLAALPSCWLSLFASVCPFVSPVWFVFFFGSGDDFLDPTFLCRVRAEIKITAASLSRPNLIR